MQLQPINPDNPQMFNGIQVSFGIAPILGAISNISRERNRPRWGLYLINIETLIRDRKDNVSDTTAIVNGVITDCEVMSQYISTYNQIVNPTSRQRPLICFYMPHYENITKTYLRDKFPKDTDKRWEIRELITKAVWERGFQNSYDNTDVVFSIADSNHKWPHKQMVQELGKVYENIFMRNTLLVSHVPIDFHLYRVFSEFTLLESYTGTFKKHKQFGKKVFGDPEIPFNKYTHLLLGDKWYIKQQVEPKIKKAIKEKATSENWNMLPDKAILKSLVEMHLPVNTDLYIKPDI